MQRSREFSSLIRDHRVLVCVGSGGVGKTTISAALALAAAQRGQNVLCLTIDPARRLASSFGLDRFPTEELTVESEFFREHDVEVGGRLTVMMLDPRATFDDLIHQFARSEEEAKRIVSRPVYGHLADNLAGTQAYMAMEKVLSVLQDRRYDLIVLDTPPSARALDFFDAPKKMGEIVDSPATRAMIRALRAGSGRFQFNLLGAGLRAALRGLEKITGGNLLFEVADLLGSMNDLLGGFEERAARVGRSLTSAEFGYLLVTAPQSRSISDAIELARAMDDRNLEISGLVLNRTATVLPPNEGESRDIAWNEMSAWGISVELGKKIDRLAAAERARAEDENLHAAPLIAALGPETPCVRLPTFGEDVYRPGKLSQLARLLVPGP